MEPMEEELSPECRGFRVVMELVGSRWSGEILRSLMTGATRFTEISEAVAGVSDRLLSERLKTLEASGLVARTVEPGPPVRIHYALTPKGEDLLKAFGALSDWADRWIGASKV